MRYDAVMCVWFSEKKQQERNPPAVGQGRNENVAQVLWPVYRFDFLPASRAPPLPRTSEWRPEEGGGNSHYFGGEGTSLATFTTSCR